MHWTPSDVLRMAALVGAFVMFALGAFMMWQGIAAEGAIDIKSSIVSGSLKTGSAGLFITFLSFVIVVFVVMTAFKHQSVPPVKAQDDDARMPISVRVFTAVFAAFIVCGGLWAAGAGQGFGIMALPFGALTALTAVVLLSTYY